MVKKTEGSTGVWAWVISLFLAGLIYIAPKTTKSWVSATVRYSLYSPFVWVDKQYNLLQDNFSRYIKVYREMGRSKIELEMLKEIREENKRLRALLEFSESNEFSMVVGEVIGNARNRFPSELTISRGTDYNIEKDDPVVISEGLIGRIVNVGPNTSIAQIFPNPALRISAVDQRSRVKGIVSSRNGRELFLEQVSKEEDIAVGDRIVTSGLGGVYPKGLPIGRVVQITDPPQSMFKEIIISPLVSTDKLEELFVIIDFNPDTLVIDSLENTTKKEEL